MAALTHGLEQRLLGVCTLQPAAGLLKRGGRRVAPGATPGGQSAQSSLSSETSVIPPYLYEAVDAPGQVSRH